MLFRSALLRRPNNLKQDHILHVGNTYINQDTFLLGHGTKSITLSKKETLFLEYFFLNANQVLQRNQILQKVWGMDRFVEEGTVDTYIHFVRRRLKAVTSDLEIKSVHGIGYCLCVRDYEENQK